MPAPNVEVFIRDHGAGIAADEQERVFERFYRIEDPWRPCGRAAAAGSAHIQATRACHGRRR